MEKSDFEIINTKQFSIKFLDELSFELRTILNGFSGPVQLLKYKTDDPSLIEIFRMFDSSLLKFKRLNSLLTIVSTLELKSFSFDKKPVNIVDVARFSALEMKALSNLENVRLKISEDFSTLFICGNFDLLFQVFQILFENIISLSAQNTNIDIVFFEKNQEKICKILSPTASLSSELNFELNEKIIQDSLTWNFMLVKRILLLHNAQLNVLKQNGSFNAFELIFKSA